MVHVMESPITFAQSTKRFVTIFLHAGAHYRNISGQTPRSVCEPISA